MGKNDMISVTLCPLKPDDREQFNGIFTSMLTAVDSILWSSSIGIILTRRVQMGQ
jgi:hypothetical protein